MCVTKATPSTVTCYFTCTPYCVCVCVTQGLCCLSVVKDFAELKQYNIQALCEQNSDKTEPSPARTDVPHTASSDKGESESQKADEVSVAEGEMMVDSTEH